MPRTSDFKNVGSPNTPQEIKRLRRENMDLCRKMGQPVIVRHRYALEDVDSGVAKKCPACYNDVYDQVRTDCPVCYGQGFASVEDNPDPLWILPDGQVYESEDQPAGSVRAPRYGGFAVPHLTWLVEPDVAVDVFRISDQGVLTQTYEATGMAPWYPKLGDSDLCINVELAPNGFAIEQTLDRFTLKMVQQVSIRGFGSRVRPSSNGQPLLVAQTFQMAKVPINQTNIYNVPVDEAWY